MNTIKFTDYIKTLELDHELGDDFSVLGLKNGEACITDDVITKCGDETILGKKKFQNGITLTGGDLTLNDEEVTSVIISNHGTRLDQYTDGSDNITEHYIRCDGFSPQSEEAFRLMILEKDGDAKWSVYNTDNYPGIWTNLNWDISDDHDFIIPININGLDFNFKVFGLEFNKFQDRFDLYGVFIDEQGLGVDVEIYVEEEPFNMLFSYDIIEILTNNKIKNISDPVEDTDIVNLRTIKHLVKNDNYSPLRNYNGVFIENKNKLFNLEYRFLINAIFDDEGYIKPGELIDVKFNIEDGRIVNDYRRWFVNIIDEFNPYTSSQSTPTFHTVDFEHHQGNTYTLPLNRNNEYDIIPQFSLNYGHREGISESEMYKYYSSSYYEGSAYSIGEGAMIYRRYDFGAGSMKLFLSYLDHGNGYSGMRWHDLFNLTDENPSLFNDWNGWRIFTGYVEYHRPTKGLVYKQNQPILRFNVGQSSLTTLTDIPNYENEKFIFNGEDIIYIENDNGWKIKIKSEWNENEIELPVIEGYTPIKIYKKLFRNSYGSYYEYTDNITIIYQSGSNFKSKVLTSISNQEFIDGPDNYSVIFNIQEDRYLIKDSGTWKILDLLISEQPCKTITSNKIHPGNINDGFIWTQYTNFSNNSYFKPISLLRYSLEYPLGFKRKNVDVKLRLDRDLTWKVINTSDKPIVLDDTIKSSNYNYLVNKPDTTSHINVSNKLFLNFDNAKNLRVGTDSWAHDRLNIHNETVDVEIVNGRNREKAIMFLDITSAETVFNFPESFKSLDNRFNSEEHTLTLSTGVYILRTECDREFDYLTVEGPY